MVSEMTVDVNNKSRIPQMKKGGGARAKQIIAEKGSLREYELIISKNK